MEVIERDLRYLEDNADIHQAMENPGERLGIGAGADNNQIVETSLISRACGYLKQGVQFAGSCAKKVVDKAADLARCAKDFANSHPYMASLVLGGICAGVGAYCYGPTIAKILAPMLSGTKIAITNGFSSLSTTLARVSKNIMDLAKKLSNLDINDELFGQKAKEILKNAFDSIKSYINLSNGTFKPMVDSFKTIYDFIEIVAKSCIELISKESNVTCTSERECEAIYDKIHAEVFEMAKFRLSNIKDRIPPAIATLVLTYILWRMTIATVRRLREQRVRENDREV